MYCPHCGKGEQAADAYCRSCGKYLPDVTGNSYLIRKLLGVSRPETLANVGLAINLVTALASLLLLVFLNGYFDAQQTRTGEPAPPVTYLVYAFLAAVAAWQVLSLAVGLRLKSRLGDRRAEASPAGPALETAGLPEGGGRALPAADFENAVPPSVTEEKTRPLDKAPRGRRD